MNAKLRLSNNHVIERTATGLAVALVIALAAGCASVSRLREAQDAFNQTAATENALRFDTKASDAAAGLLSVRGGYASALLSLEKLEGTKEQQQLSNDGLRGVALSLKALSQWRLGQYEKAVGTAELAITSAGGQIYPRDLALMTALPGLVKTDQAYDKILRTNAAAAEVATNNPALAEQWRTNTLVEVKRLLVGERGAIANLKDARAQVDKDHPVQVYLLQAQLAAYRNYQVAWELLKNQAVVPPGDPARTDAKGQLKELSRVLAEADAPGENLVKYWARVCGLSTP